jgi:hypothetical protein
MVIVVWNCQKDQSFEALATLLVFKSWIVKEFERTKIVQKGQKIAAVKTVTVSLS